MMSRTCFIWILLGSVLFLSPCQIGWADEWKVLGDFEVDTRVYAPPTLKGWFWETLDDESILTVSGTQVYRTQDDGQSWDSWALSVEDHPELSFRNPVLLQSDDGPLIMVGMDFHDYTFSWNNTLNLPDSSCNLDVWSMRSLDGGHTWIDAQKIYDGYDGAIHDIIQTASGEIVVPIQPLLYDEGRHATQPYVSSDNGLSWQPSTLIDTGGRGHHDGAIESTLVELDDGRLWMLSRTSLDQFWSSYSDDQGYTWDDQGFSEIDASHSPGKLTRLQSGRLVMVWNRLYPEGQNTYPRINEYYSARPATWMRHELSIAFSEDDGQTWTEPVIIARDPDKGYISYPSVFEHSPGELWIALGQGGGRFAINEADFVSEPFDYVFEMPKVTTPRSSDQFTYCYEFDVDPTDPSQIDLDANGQPDFDKAIYGPFTFTDHGTIVFESYLESGLSDNSSSNLWPNVGFNTTEGFTLEWRMKVLSDTGIRGAFAIVVELEEQNVLPLFEIRDDGQCIGGNSFPYELGENDNADDFHVFRLVRDADDNSGLWWLWRDGELLTPVGMPITTTGYQRDALFFGDFGVNYAGTVELDYFRIESGAFAPAYLPGDANNDGKVDGSDVTILAGNWQKGVNDGQTATWADGDFNGDGRVDGSDVTILAGNWQYGVEAAETSVPEPSTLTLSLLMLLGLLVLRHKKNACIPN